LIHPPLKYPFSSTKSLNPPQPNIPSPNIDKYRPKINSSIYYDQSKEKMPEKNISTPQSKEYSQLPTHLFRLLYVSPDS